jgi:hypothetical protein
MNTRTRYVVTSVALAALAASWIVLQRPATHASPSLPRPAALAPPAARILAPTASDLLGADILLELAPGQRTRLMALASGWAKEATSVQAEVDAATADFSRFMDEARSTGRTTVQEIQRRSADIAALSELGRERRRQHSDDAVAVLMSWQRVRLDRVPRADASGGAR